MTINTSRAACMFALLFLFVQVGKAQTPQQAVLINRLCKTWKIEKIINGSAGSSLDQALNDFRLIMNPDHTIQQGIYPDGMIKGTWEVDEKQMLLTIKDDVTSQNYPMKIISLTADELALQGTQTANDVMIYYTTK